MLRDSIFSPTTLLGIHLPRFFTRRRTQRSSGSVSKLTPSFQSRNRSALSAARDTSVVDGRTIILLPFSWAQKVRRPQPDQEGTDVGNTCIKTSVLLGRSFAGSPPRRLEWCHLACHSEDRTCNWTSAYSLSRMVERVRTCSNPWLWVWANHLAEVGRQDRPIHSRRSSLPREVRVVCFRQQLVCPWLMK